MRLMKHFLIVILLLNLFQGLSLAQGRTIYVNGAYSGAIEDGSRLRPYKTVAKAMAAAVDGDAIHVQSGVYPEAVRLNKRVRVRAENGSAIIGKRLQVQNEHLSLGFDFNRGIAMTSIMDRVTRHEYLTTPLSSFFEFAVNNGKPYQSNNGVVVDGFSRTPDGSQLVINSHATEAPLAFSLTITLAGGDSAAILQMRVTNTGNYKMFLRTVMPKIQGLVTPGDPAQMMGMVPQEIGSVAPLRDNCITPPPKPTDLAHLPVELKDQCTLGMDFNIGVGLPTSMNAMEVASIYDPAGGGGLFFADVEGNLDTSPNAISPIQFNLSAAEVTGFWITDLQPSQAVNLPALAIGVHHEGDWHRAVDYYVGKHGPKLKFPAIPAWFRDQGAIYSFAGGGAGGIYLDLSPLATLNQRISSFDKLPDLLTEAQALGTNVVYLWDYWEAAPEPLCQQLQKDKIPPHYANKGDYTPRGDLGGADALKRGIQAIHQRGGKVILYLEPFMIYEHSQLAKEKGEAWGGRDPSGNLYRNYACAYSMVAPFVPWQNEVVRIAQRLVGEYGADGILLDSWGWQMNWPMKTQESQLYSAKEYSQGVLTLAGKVRAAIQGINPYTPDAVVIGETTAGPLSQHLDGGLSADFAWLRKRNRGRITASPVRYGFPEVNFISNGTTLNELHQIYAAGHSLALCSNYPGSFMHAEAPRIKRLVEFRQAYKDALIYGRRSYQPATGNEAVASYFYQGTQNAIITVVNTSDTANYSGTLILRSSEANSTWKDLLTGEVFLAQSLGRMPIAVPAGGLRVLWRQG